MIAVSDELYVAAADGSGWCQLTDKPIGDEFGRDRSPDVSPDGRRLAYVTLREALTSSRVRSFEIVTTNIDGENRIRLTRDEALDVSPVWSPDGTRIAFLSSSEGLPVELSLHIMAADGSDVERIAPSVRASGDLPVWSPDGSMLAFFGLDHALEPRKRSFVYVVNADGTDLRQVAESPQIWNASGRGGPGEYGAAFWGLGWSPDSSRIAFTRWEMKDETPGHPVELGLLAMDADGGNQRMTDEWVEYQPHDGTQEPYFGNGQLAAVAVDGAEFRGKPRLGRGEVWSSDLSKVALFFDLQIIAYDFNAPWNVQVYDFVDKGRGSQSPRLPWGYGLPHDSMNYTVTRGMLQPQCS